MLAGGGYTRIYEVVKQIPSGRVATYGQVASRAGLRGHACQVGYALSALPEGSEVPWHRVVNSKGRISKKREPAYDALQRTMLEAEGIVFNAHDRVSLSRYGWKPTG